MKAKCMKHKLENVLPSHGGGKKQASSQLAIFLLNFPLSSVFRLHSVPHYTSCYVNWSVLLFQFLIKVDLNIILKHKTNLWGWVSIVTIKLLQFVCAVWYYYPMDICCFYYFFLEINYHQYTPHWTIELYL